MASPQPSSPPRTGRPALPTLLLLANFAVYFALAGRVAVQRPLWYDEMFTVAICRLPTLSDVWRVLASGVDQTPPLAYVFFRLASALGPESSWAPRLASLLGFAVLAAALYLVLRRHVPPVWALAGALVPFVTQAIHFSWEARSYAVVLGFEGLALLAWERSGDAGPHRRWIVAGLALAGAAAASCHYTAILIVVPLALGEIVRSLERRQLALAVWAALAAPFLPLALYIPLMRGVRSYAKVFWARPDLTTLPGAYTYLVGLTLPLFVGLAVLWLGWMALSRSPGLDLRGLRPGLAVAAGFLLLPALGCAGSLIAGAFTPRYTIWAVAGLALAIAYLGAATSGGSPVLGRIVAVCLILTAVGVEFGGWRKWEKRGTSMLRLARTERLAEAGAPVVYADPLAYVQFAWYAPDPIARRVWYLTSPQGALLYAHTDNTERSLLWLADQMHFNVTPAAPFLQANRRFWVIGGGGQDWLVPALVASGATVVLKEPQLFEVALGPDSVAALTKSIQ